MQLMLGELSFYAMWIGTWILFLIPITALMKMIDDLIGWVNEKIWTRKRSRRQINIIEVQEDEEYPNHWEAQAGIYKLLYEAGTKHAERT